MPLSDEPDREDRDAKPGRWAAPEVDPFTGRRHWYEELLETGGREVLIEPIKLGPSRRVTPRRRS